MKDRFNREIDYVRISITDKCNLRCKYCMPKEGVKLFSHEEILEFEEIQRLCKILTTLGIKKVKLTGGEPLVRKDFLKLVAMIHSVSGIEDITITTNGVLLSDMIDALAKNGVTGINLSLDTLNRENFTNITRVDAYDKVIAGLKKCVELGIKLKINTVPCKEFNIDELTKLARLSKDYPIDVRFIELMPIGLGNEFNGIESDEILRILREEYGSYEVSSDKHGNGPARYVNFSGFKGSIGFISSLSHKFCGECNRVRITADGRLKLCLYHTGEISLRDMIREGKTDEEIKAVLYEQIFNKPVSHSFENTSDKISNTMNKIGG